MNINFLLKQPIFRTAEDILKNYNRPINIRFESGKYNYFIFCLIKILFLDLFSIDLTAPPTHRLFPISFK